MDGGLPLLSLLQSKEPTHSTYQLYNISVIPPRRVARQLENPSFLLQVLHEIESTSTDTTYHPYVPQISQRHHRTLLIPIFCVFNSSRLSCGQARLFFYWPRHSRIALYLKGIAFAIQGASNIEFRLHEMELRNLESNTTVRSGTDKSL